MFLSDNFVFIELDPNKIDQLIKGPLSTLERKYSSSLNENLHMPVGYSLVRYIEILVCFDKVPTFIITFDYTKRARDTYILINLTMHKNHQKTMDRHLGIALT